MVNIFIAMDHSWAPETPEQFICKAFFIETLDSDVTCQLFV